MSFADLAADTAVRADPAVAGRYHIDLPNSWDYLLPSGGVIMTAALRAAEAHVGDLDLRLASATTIFASPVHPGALVAALAAPQAIAAIGRIQRRIEIGGRRQRQLGKRVAGRGIDHPVRVAARGPDPFAGDEQAELDVIGRHDFPLRGHIC